MGVIFGGNSGGALQITPGGNAEKLANSVRNHLQVSFSWNLSRGGTPTILGGGVPHGSQNPDPISDQNICFFIPLFRPDPENLYP